MLASRGFLLAGLLVFLLDLGKRGMDAFVLMMKMGPGGPGFESRRGWPSIVAVVLGAAVYLWLCRRATLRRLLLAAVGVTAAAIAAAFASGSGFGGPAGEVRTALGGLAVIPLMDLSLRVVPEGLEACGLSLLLGASSLAAGLGPAAAALLPDLGPPSVFAVFLGVSLLGLIPVLLLPAALVAKGGAPEPREG